jgi:hypothetical protein
MDFKSIYAKFGDGSTDAKSKLKSIYQNPSKYTQAEIKSAFYGALDKPSYRGSFGMNEDYYRNVGSDDDDWVKDETKFSTDTNTYQNALNSLLLSARAVAAPSPAPAAPAPAPPKPKAPVLAPDRDFGQGDSGESAAPGSDQDPTTYMGMTPAEYEDYLFNRGTARDLALGDQDARSRALIASLNKESAREVASIRSTASMYGSDRSFDATDVSSRRTKEARMYEADRGKEATLGKAQIDGAFGVKMQNIIARGAQDVEKIRGEYGLAGQQIVGEYGLERSRIEGATARDVANRQRDASIFGALVSGFWS